MNRHKGMIFGFSIVLFFVFPALAFGYIDPGTGSYIIQILIAALLGGGLAVKIFWQKIKAFFGKIFQKKQK